MSGYFRITKESRQLLRGADGSVVCVYMYLVELGNSTGTCFPSIKKISEESGYSVESVKRAIRKLEEKGLIARNQRSRQTTLYEITKHVNPSKEINKEMGVTHDPQGGNTRPPIKNNLLRKKGHFAVQDENYINSLSIHVGGSATTLIESNRKSDLDLEQPLSYYKFRELLQDRDPVLMDRHEVPLKIMEMFLKEYLRNRGEFYPRLRYSQWLRYMKELLEYECKDSKGYLMEYNAEETLESYFNSRFKGDCDYRLPHFVSLNGEARFMMAHV